MGLCVRTQLATPTQHPILRRMPIAVLALFLAAGLANQGQAGAASFNPSALAANAGQGFTVSLTDTISSADTIAALDLEVDFDPAVFAFIDATLGVLLTPDWTITSYVFSPGVALISASETPVGQDAMGTDTVIGLNFSALLSAASGSFDVTVRNTPASDGVAGQYQLAPVIFTVSVTAAPPPPPIAVPAPGLAALALPALALVYVRRRFG